MRATLCLSLACLWFPIHAGDCPPTPGRTIGTHYDPGRVAYRPGDLGKGLILTGRVLSAFDCSPVPGARIIHWQAGRAGRYVDRLYAWRRAGTDGGYRFETEWPALSRPHVHFLVEAPGHTPLTTEWVGGQRVGEARFDLILRPID